jgi:hypothetical protein
VNQQIMCTVHTCDYWGQGNVCRANKILVTSDAISNSYPESVDANQVTQLVQQVGLTPANTSMETCCKTFTPKKS